MTSRAGFVSPLISAPRDAIASATKAATVMARKVKGAESRATYALPTMSEDSLPLKCTVGLAMLGVDVPKAPAARIDPSRSLI